MSRRRSEAGFTLLEVLVALVIAALALGVMFSAVLGGLRTAAVADHLQEALVLARSHLAEAQVAVGSGKIVAQSEQQGDDGHGFHWTVQIRPTASVAIARNPDAPPGAGASHSTLFAIAVTEFWAGDGGHRQVQLDSAKLAGGPPAGA
jgi:general secretion pathway protein I